MPSLHQQAGHQQAGHQQAGHQQASKQAPSSKLTTTPRIGLALGGGGARGLAHILVLEVFDELGIKPVMIAGTSIGALFGAAYASGLSAALIRASTEETLSRRFDMVRQLFAARSDPVQKLLNLLPLRHALLNPQALLDLVLPAQVARDFSQLTIPLQLVATDLGSQSAFIMQSGSLRDAIAGSIAIPVIFQPVLRDGRTLVDGGLVNPLPFDLVGADASGRAVDITVAIDVTGASATDVRVAAQPTAMLMAAQSLQILQKSITIEKLRSRRPDVYIDVQLDQYNALEFHKVADILKAAAPAKEALKRQLTRVLGAETLPVPAQGARPTLPNKRGQT
jgi:NTE family protein